MPGLRASGTWIFTAILPYILNSPGVVHESYLEQVESLSLVVRIQSIVLAPVTCADGIATLSRLITAHHQTFVKLYLPSTGFNPQKRKRGEVSTGAARVVNKMHYLKHLPEQMRQFGPGRSHWCMRYENKHVVLKFRDYNNTRNVSYSALKATQVRTACDLPELVAPPFELKAMDGEGRISEVVLNGDRVSVGSVFLLRPRPPFVFGKVLGFDATDENLKINFACLGLFKYCPLRHVFIVQNEQDDTPTQWYSVLDLLIPWPALVLSDDPLTVVCREVCDVP